ncbi:MAG: hypothetical protein DRN12_03435 [Thermoplasmata archaeon]|nr:MAG: hypothetical protein DRN12_03435 [Thermoplasmata archaeon]
MNIKKVLSISIIVLFLLIPISSIIDARYPLDEIKVTYSFNHPTIRRISIDNKLYEDIKIPGISNSGNPGEPLLPTKSAYILLPPNAEVEEIKIRTLPSIYLGGGHLLLPASQPVPTDERFNIHPPTPLKSLYSSRHIFPNKFYTYIGKYNFRGYTILVLALHPVRYLPFTGELFYYPSFTVIVKTSRTNDKPLLYRGLDEDKKEVLKKIDNPGDIYLYSNLPSDTLSDDQYDMLILTTDKLKNHFKPLKEAHEARGLRTRIKTLSEISITKPTPEDIREFLRNEYINHGIKYLLLGGDSDVVPAKMLYVSGLDENRWFYDTTMPSDLYYACLDGPYNYNGNDKWGEPDDGENGKDVDLIAEIYVGRACVDNTDDVDNFALKTVSYMNTDPSGPYLTKVLLAGEYLGDYGVASWGGNYLDQIVDGSNYDNYTTVGIPSDTYDIIKMYDRDWPDNYWSPEDLINYINQGIHILNHDGHSYYGYNMRLTNSGIEYMENDQYFFDYSIGCMSGGFDNPEGYDCFAETLTVKTPHGAFAAIMNARYGFFWSYSTDGDSNRYVREFWDALFGEHIYSIGAANHDSKEDNLYLINRSCMRWVYYETNLFGDPAVTFHIGKPPSKPTIDGPTEGKVGEKEVYTIVAADPDGDNVSYFIEFDDEGNWTGFHPSGKPINVTWIWKERGVHTIRVKAKDENGLESEWSVLTIRVNSKTFIILKNVKTILSRILNIYSKI